MGGERLTEEIWEQTAGAGPSAQDVGNKTGTRADRGTSTSSDVRFCPYDTPDTIRHKVVRRRL